MKKFAITLAIILAISSLAACSNSKSANDAVVVKTKAGNITEKAFVKKLKDKYGKQTLQEMVYLKLLEDKYKVSKSAVDKKFNEQKAQYGSDQQFQQALAQNNLTEADFRQMTKEQLLLNKAQTDGVKVTEKEMKDYYNKNKANLIQVKASHILVKDKKTADEVEQKLKNGKKFADLAKQYSTDTGSAKKGGDLGWFGKGDMVPSFEKAAFSMKVGDISQPVKSQYGYHIIKLTGKKDSYDALKDVIKKDVLDKNKKSVQQVLTQLQKEGNIKVEDKNFKDLFKTPSPSTSSNSSKSQG